MNRIIKFRAWHTKINKMFSPEEMGEDQLTIMPNGRGFINVHGGLTRLSEFIPEMIPMQFTGLLDKNGNEIYEWDIVRTDINGKMWVVEMKDFSWWVNNHDIVDNGKNKFGGMEKYTFREYLSLLKKAPKANLEIIGNLYQTPELANPILERRKD